MTRRIAMPWRVVLAALVAVCACPACTAAGQGRALRPPPGFAATVGHAEKDVHECPTQAQPYTGAMDFPSKFEGSDKARDDLNKKAEAEYRRRIEPISALERGLSQQVEDYLRSGKPESLRCSLDLLQRWAQAGALMGEATTHTGKSMRKWTLGSVSAAYLRLKFSVSAPLRDEAQRVQQIEAWLATLAGRVVEEWRDQPLEKMNNHEYWAAWAVAAAAVAVDRRDLFDWALGQFRIGANQVDALGFLPNELSRDTRALYYHNYALTPLSMIAAFARANDVAISDATREALARLAQRVLSGVDDPTAFRERTGKKQVIEDFSERSKFAWMEPYCWTFSCGEEVGKRLASLRPLKAYRLGGNLTELFAALPADTAPQSRKETSTWINPLASR